MKRKVVALVVSLSLLANLFAFSISFASATAHASSLALRPMATQAGTIQFKAYNGLFVTADVNNGGALTANRSAASTWETFDIFCNADGTVSFRAHANNMFVSARFNLSNTPLIANQSQIQSWEEFNLFLDPNYTGTPYGYALETASGVNFASADPNHSLQLLADRSVAKLWEHYAIAVSGNAC